MSSSCRPQEPAGLLQPVPRILRPPEPGHRPGTVLYCTVLYCTVLYCTGQGGDEADNWDYDGSGDYDMGDYKPPCVGACAVIKLSHCCTSIYTIKCKNRNLNTESTLPKVHKDLH